MPDKLLSVREAAKLLSVSIQTLRRWEKHNVLTPLRTSGNQRRYTLEQIEKFKVSRRKILKKVFYSPPKTQFYPQNQAYQAVQNEILKESAEEKLVSIKEASRILRVSVPTLRRWEKDGIIRPARTAGNQRRYSRHELGVFSRSKKESFQPILEKRYHRGLEYLEKRLPKLSLFQKGVLIGCVSALITSTVLVLGVKTGVFEHGFQQAVKIAQKPAQILLTLGKIHPTNLDDLTLQGDALQGLPGQSNSSKLSLKSGVLGVQTNRSISFNVNVPTEFADDAQFLSNLGVSGAATVSGDLSVGSIIGLNAITAPFVTATLKLTAPNVVYGISAGSGISTSSAGQYFTINNSGVLSVGGKTGAVTLAAGSGISVSDTTITNSSSIFKTVSVDSSSFDASSLTDTLSFASGSNISLTTDTSNKKITINGTSAASGFILGSGYIYPANTTVDLLLGGQSSSSASFHVFGKAGLAGTNPVASISADSSTAALIIDQKNNFGDLFTASSSGVTQLRLTNGGTLDVKGAYAINGTTGSTISSASCEKSVIERWFKHLGNYIIRTWGNTVFTP